MGQVLKVDPHSFQMTPESSQSFLVRTAVKELVNNVRLPLDYKNTISRAVTMVLDTPLNGPNGTSKTKVLNAFSSEFVKLGVAKLQGNVQVLNSEGLGTVAQHFFHTLSTPCNETENGKLCPFTATKAYQNLVEPKISSIIEQDFQGDPEKQWRIEMEFQMEMFNRLIRWYASSHGVLINNNTKKPFLKISKTVEQEQKLADDIRRASYSLLVVFSILTTMTALHYRIPQRIGSAFRSMIHKFKSLMKKPEVTNALEEIQLSGGLKHRTHKTNFWTREAKEAFREVSGRNLPTFGSFSGHAKPASSRGSWSWPKLLEIERIPYEGTGKTGTKTAAKKSAAAKSSAATKKKKPSATKKTTAPKKVSAENFLKLPPSKKIEVLGKNNAGAVKSETLNQIIAKMRLKKREGKQYKKSNKVKLVLKALR